MNMNFKNETPDNINDLAVPQVLPLAGEDGMAGLPSPKVRLNLTKMLYEVLGYDLTPDVALATIAQPQAMLVLATAGGGKTTWAQIKAVLQKIIQPSVLRPGTKIRGAAILCLVYNRHNVADMEDKHKQMVARLQAANIRGLNIDNSINACTMHSFCDFWRREYVAKMGLLGSALLEEGQAVSFMRRAVKTACKKAGQKRAEQDIDAKAVYSLYTLYKETMCSSVSELENFPRFKDIGMSADLAGLVFERYERTKQLNRKYDFTDMLIKFYELMKTDNVVHKRVQKFYEYVIADEVQDFTPLMWSILSLLVDDGTPLTCIGDEDQNIYSFRGADIENILSFSQRFPDGRVYSLEYNRRCRKEILDAARNVIERNTLRFNKTLRGTKDGGKVSFLPYSTMNAQMINVTKALRAMTDDERENTVVCYRDTVLSTVLADMLAEEDIPFNVISGVGAFKHELYRHIINVLDCLEMGYDMDVCINLYKVLPCTKDDFFETLGYDPAKHKFSREFDKTKHFSQYEYGRLEGWNSFRETMAELARLSQIIDTVPMKQIVPSVYKLLCKYFWNFKMQMNNTAEIDELMESRVLAFFSSDMTYSEFFKEYQIKLSRYNRYSSNRDGVTLSTFHSLKGLEFKNVIVVCMDDSIFPNFNRIQADHYSEDVEQKLMESETRLWYVAITRAIDTLTVHYSSSNPSLYVHCALTNDFTAIGRREDVLDSALEEELSSDGVSDNSNFPLVNDSDDSDFPLADDFADADLDLELDFTPITPSAPVSAAAQTAFSKSESKLSVFSADSMTAAAEVPARKPSEDESLKITLKSGRGIYMQHLLKSLSNR